LQDQNRNLFNQIKNITYKEIKNYKTYDKLTELAKNMNLVLPLIDNLNCEDMKDRHWNELSLVSGKPINHTSAAFCMKDLIDLQLFNFSDKVNEIVEVAKNQEVNRKKLIQITKNWEKLAFQFEFSKERESFMLTEVEKIIEILEADQMEILNMAAQGK